VQLLHGYYLDEKSKRFFELDPAQQKLRLESYNIFNDLAIEPTDECKKTMSRYRIKTSQSDSGFFAGLEVRQQSGIELPFSFPLKQEDADKETFDLIFKIKIKNSYISHYSNMRLATSEAPYRFYFTNENKQTATAPSLSEPVAAFTNGRVYEMSELAVIDGTLKQALEQTTVKTANKWQIVPDFKWVNENDKKALPKKFVFQLPSTVKTAQVTLKSAAIEMTAVFKSMEPLKNIDLDYSKAPDGIYQLMIAGNDGFQYTKEIYLCKELTDANCLGIIRIAHKKGLSAGFNILTPQNGLITEGGTSGRPFDIRFLTRLTYRKIYDNANQVISKNLKPSDNALYIYNADQMILSTKQSYPLTKAAAKLTISNGDLTLPEPNVRNLTKEELRFYSEIFI
jgi:hypothetical protein